LKIDSDKVMELGKVYQVKNVICKVTKDPNGFSTRLLKFTHGFDQGKKVCITGCYVYLGKEIPLKQMNPDQRQRIYAAPMSPRPIPYASYNSTYIESIEPHFIRERS
jgi:hypothetical protein